MIVFHFNVFHGVFIAHTWYKLSQEHANLEMRK